MNRIGHFLISVLLVAITAGFANSIKSIDTKYWAKIPAANKVERSHIAQLGVSIEYVGSDYVMAIADDNQIAALRSKGFTVETHALNNIGALDFPNQDSAFHNYSELTSELKSLAQQNPDILVLDSIGKSVEGRDIWHLGLSDDIVHASEKPAIVFLGGHHAREHISVEIPLKLAQKLVADYRANDEEVIRLMRGRMIHIIPQVNPDGSEFDISNNLYYQYWRKNRASGNRPRSGVDLNRNYDFHWGTTGTSSDPSSDVYSGPSAFSEPETRAVKAFIERTKTITTLLSFHTFSELVLYPWGHTDDRMPDDRDFLVHKTLAETMAKWNGYTPMQSADLYEASGDTTDWAYGVHHIFSFTFELDPKNMQGGGFYPGARAIDVVFNKNYRPCLYLIDYADNPYRVIEPNHKKYGFESAILD